MDTKVCTKCGGTFPATEEYFYWRTAKHDRLSTMCRVCKAAAGLRNFKAKRAAYYETCRQWRIENKEAVLAHARAWKKAHRSLVSKSNAAWAKANLDKVRGYHVKCYVKRKPSIAAHLRKKYRERQDYRIAVLHRNRLYAALKARAVVTERRKVRGLGIQVVEYIKWLGAKFEPGMSWDNRGRYSQTASFWHVDHVIPLLGVVDGEPVFDLSSPDDQAVAFSYLNTQPMWALPNHLKSNKVPHWDTIPPELQAICTPRIRALLQKVKKTA